MTSSLEERLAAVEAVVRVIPSGRVLSYGGVAERLPFPATARQVGKWMTLVEESAPWWRVVGADGSYPIERRDPRLSRSQAQLLASEGTRLLPSGRVAAEAFLKD